MHQPTLSKTLSLGLAALMTLATLGAIDGLSVQAPQAELMAAKASPLARTAAPAGPTAITTGATRS